MRRADTTDAVSHRFKCVSRHIAVDGWRRIVTVVDEELAMAVSLLLNGKRVTLDVEPDVPLLWAIREAAGLPGTKYGCGMAFCGACTVHLDGRTIRSCVTPVRSVANKPITTIEGVSGPLAEAVLQSWEKLDVPQCGYCQPGQIMSASGQQICRSSHDGRDPHCAANDSAFAGQT